MLYYIYRKELNSIKKLTLKQARFLKGYRQIDIATMMNVKRLTVWNWENGKTKMPAEKFMAICVVLGYGPNEIEIPEKKKEE